MISFWLANRKSDAAFEGNHQHDCHECLRHVIDHLHETQFTALANAAHVAQSQQPDQSIPVPIPPTYVDTLFCGRWRYTTCCRLCRTETTGSEPFRDLSLPVPVSDQPAGLPSCLDTQFKDDEVLKGDNQFSCTECQAYTDATRSFRFEALPPVLTILLKRFDYHGSGKASWLYALDKPRC